MVGYCRVRDNTPPCAPADAQRAYDMRDALSRCANTHHVNAPMYSMPTCIQLCALDRYKNRLPKDAIDV